RAAAGCASSGLTWPPVGVRLPPEGRPGGVLAATAVLGYATHAIAGAISAKAVAGAPSSTGWIANLLRDWVVIPANTQALGDWGYVLLICLLIALVQAKRRWPAALPGATLYHAARV